MRVSTRTRPQPRNNERNRFLVPLVTVAKPDFELHLLKVFKVEDVHGYEKEQYPKGNRGLTRHEPETQADQIVPERHGVSDNCVNAFLDQPLSQREGSGTGPDSCECSV